MSYITETKFKEIFSVYFSDTFVSSLWNQLTNNTNSTTTFTCNDHINFTCHNQFYCYLCGNYGFINNVSPIELFECPTCYHYYKQQLLFVFNTDTNTNTGICVDCLMKQCNLHVRDITQNYVDLHIKLNNININQLTINEN